jgi:hypothetical protein
VALLYKIAEVPANSNMLLMIGILIQLAAIIINGQKD